MVEIRGWNRQPLADESDGTSDDPAMTGFLRRRTRAAGVSGELLLLNALSYAHYRVHDDGTGLRYGSASNRIPNSKPIGKSSGAARSPESPQHVSLRNTSGADNVYRQAPILLLILLLLALPLLAQPLLTEPDPKALEAQRAQRHRCGSQQYRLVHSNLGNYHQALDFYQQALEVNRREGSRIGIAANLNNIGYIYLRLDRYEEAIDFGLECLEIREALDCVEKYKSEMRGGWACGRYWDRNVR